MRASIRFGGKTQFVTGARVIIDPSSPPQALVMTVVAGDDIDGVRSDLQPPPVPLGDGSGGSGGGGAGGGSDPVGEVPVSDPPEHADC